MQFEKKSQGALEFILIFVFVLAIVSILMYIIGLYSLDVQKQKNEKVVEDFADSINKEVLILQKVKSGYYRRLEIPKYLMERYDVKINSSFILIRDIEIEGDDASIRKFDIQGDFKIIQEFNSSTNVSYLIFKKDFVDNYVGLDLVTN